MDNLARFKWLFLRDSVLAKFGVLPTSPYPVRVRFTFGNGRMSDARFASDIPAGVACGLGKFSALSMNTNILRLLFKCALESLGRQVGASRNMSTSGRFGIEVLLKVDGMGHDMRSVASFRKRDGPWRAMGRRSLRRGFHGIWTVSVRISHVRAVAFFSMNQCCCSQGCKT